MNVDLVPVYVVVPTYNEAQSIPVLLREIFELGIKNINVLIVDDNSPDCTAKVARCYARDNGLSVSILNRRTKKGLGSAYVEGFKEVLLGHPEEEVFVVQMDADMSHNPSYLPSMIELLARNDVVVGSRYCQEGGSDEKWSVYRKRLSACGNWAIRFVSGLKVNDCTSGFKVFRMQVLKDISWDEIRCSGFGFQIEIAMQCENHDFRIQEYPIIFNDRVSGDSKMSISIVLEAIFKIICERFKIFKVIKTLKPYT
ncbi:MAG: dolichol-phosphate mannosyltransferase [Chloroflexi bacterium]|jgi:dolichol-phosphate mannosyltransferase|nr:MAG: dolichol-phosphate mannosyltransferase [Chloroflexota bacterium]